MATAGNITAVLTLNASKFNSGIQSANTALDKFKESITSFTSSSGEISKGIVDLHNHLGKLKTSLESLNMASSSFKNFNTLALSIQRISRSIIELGTSTVKAETGINIINSIFQAFGGALNNVEIKVKGVSSSMNQMGSSARSNASSINQMAVATTQYSVGATNVRRTTDQLTASLRQNSEAMRLNGAEQLRNMGYTGRLSIEEEKASASSQKLATTQQQVANASRQSGTAMNSMSSSAQRGSASMNQMASTSTKLGQALYSLMRVGRLVAIMFGYQIAYQFLHATTETVNARSEMENYARMLNWSTEEQDSFNKSLDDTVSKFQRVNKYSLGETTMSIGVEFDLTPSQMTKANPIIAMITSEYMRAGRTPEEASLAVKDILQGEFTRLSRETGVGEEELIEAGWSGDIKDIEGLLDALQKVGTSRHWDQFAEKAHSLNDAITILQNRFGEWSAEMVNVVQPAILNVFNEIMEVAGGLSGILGGVWQWLSGEGLAQSIVKWTGLGTVLLTVLGSIIKLRTGANLLQIAQMGLTNTIGATVLGLNAETVAEYGLRNAILSRTTGVRAETVSEIGAKNAILSKILGLDAEIIKEEGLKNAITTSAFAREMERMQLRGATEEEIANTFALYQNELANRRTTTVLLAHAMGLEMTTLAEEGFLVALLEANTGMEASQIATMGLAGKMALLTVSMIAPLAIVSAFAIAFGGLALEINNSADAMKKFNGLVNDSNGVAKKGYATVQKYTKKQQDLQAKLDGLEEGTEEYNKTQKELNETTDLLTQANYDYENSMEAVRRATSAQQNYDSAKDEMRLNNQKELAKAYQEAGYSAEEANKLANNYLNEAEAGAQQLRRTLQEIAIIEKKHLYDVNNILNSFENDPRVGLEIFGVKDPRTEYIQWSDRIHSQMESGMEKAMTDESFFGRIDGWLGYYSAHIENWYKDIKLNLDTKGIQSALEGATWGAVHGFGKLPIFKDLWSTIFNATGITEHFKGKGWAGFGEAFKNIITADFGNGPSNIFPVILGYAVKFGDDSAETLKTGVATGFWKSIDKWDKDVAEWEKGIVDKVQKWADGIPAWLDACWVNFATQVNQSLSQVWDNLVQNWDNFWAEHPLIDEEGVKSFFGDIETIKQVIFDWWNNLTSSLGSDVTGGIGDFVGMLFNFENMSAKLSQFASQIPSLFNTYIVQPISTALYDGIMSIPFVTYILEMLGLVDQVTYDADGKGRTISQAIQKGIEDVLRNIPILGDILQVLGVIPQANGDASTKGHGVGDSIKTGLKTGMGSLGQMITQEFQDGINGIANLFGEAWNTAKGYGEQLWGGVNSILQRKSPGFIHDQIVAEFGTDIPSAIDDSGATAFASAQSYGQQVVDGVSGMYSSMPQVAMDFFTNGALSEYQTDANTVTTLSDDLSLTTTNAFATMQSGVNSSVTGMATDVLTSYTSMQQNQNTMMNNMQTANLNGYRQMQLQTNQQLMTMRNETQQVTTQMIQAWSHMKTQLVATADALKSESASHFNSLSSTIGSFYRKIQNPANWGAGHGSGNVRTARNPTVGKSFAKGIKTRSGSAKHYAGGDYYTGRQTMTLRTLKNLMCPNGDCGDIFDGMDLNKTVDVNEFLASVGLGHGFGTWGSWKGTHYNYIKDRSDQWNMKSPQLLGRINTDANFKVGDFENGTPKISFGSFQSMAESLFSAIPYKFYYDSSWKGSWLGAIQAGACNCYDGASALIAFANTCGFSGSMAHGTWNGIPHVWAVIEGRKMDTTGWQQRGTWTPSASAGGLRSTRYAGGESKTYNITIEIDTVYGEDDFENRIRESAQKVMREEFNDPYTIPI